MFLKREPSCIELNLGPVVVAKSLFEVALVHPFIMLAIDAEATPALTPAYKMSSSSKYFLYSESDGVCEQRLL